MKVLVVNSVPVMRETILDALERLGYYRAVNAPTIEAAQCQLLADSHDLIITDLSLTDGWGMQFIKAVRSCPKNYQAKLIVITHAKHTDRIDELKACGVAHCLFLKRPGDLRRLEEMIEDLFTRLAHPVAKPDTIEKPASKETFLEVYDRHEEGSTEIVDDKLILVFDNARLSICLEDLLQNAKLEVFPARSA